MNEENDKVYVNLKKVPLESERNEKKQKRKKIFLYSFILILFLFIGFGLGIIFYRDLYPRKNADATNTLGEIEALLENYWLYSDEYEDLQSELEDKAFYGMTEFEDDPYTTYMSKKEMEEFSESINMEYVGIGVVYVVQGDYPLIERVIINSPAEKAGMQAGDIITHVDGESTSGMESSELKEKVLGEEGTIVTITVLRGSEYIDMKITRAAIDNSVYCYAEDDYVVLHIYSFGETTAKDCMTYLDQYTDYKKIIIDLRNDGGGYQTSVSEICGLFIGSDRVYLKQEDKNGNVLESKTSCTKTYTNFDSIVLLVNENTASAAEVFTICLKEQLDNVTIVGTTTYGKGVIQSSRYLSNGGAIKFTSYRWYSPNGNSIHGTGIIPDVEVKEADIYYEQYEAMEEDEVLELDSVSDKVAVAQKCLTFLNYYDDRQDGYFNEEFADALKEFKIDNDLNADSKLDKQTYDCLISEVVASLAKQENDYQMLKAIEIIKED